MNGTNESQFLLNFALITSNFANYPNVIKKYHNIDFINIYNNSDETTFNLGLKNETLFDGESLPIIYKHYSNYISFIAPDGNSIFIKKYNKNIIVNDNREQSENSIFSIQNNKLSSIIVIHYLYKNKQAIHVKYIAKNSNDFNSLIGFVNYIQEYIIKRDIIFYSIAGITKLHSAKWNKLLKKKFKNVHISPTYFDNFITCINKKLGICTPDFLLISKSLAPKGVYFYVTDLFSYELNKFSLIAEIYDSNGYKKNINDKTEDIYKYALNNQLLPKNVITEKSVDLEGYNLNQVNIYEKF